MSSDSMNKYSADFNIAVQKLKEALPEDTDSALIENIRNAVIETLSGILDQLMNQTYDAAVALGSLEYIDGKTAAVKFAESMGITDAEILTLVGEVGIRQAVMWIETGLSHERTMQLAASRAGYDDDGYDFDF